MPSSATPARVVSSDSLASSASKPGKLGKPDQPSKTGKPGLVDKAGLASAVRLASQASLTGSTGSTDSPGRADTADSTGTARLAPLATGARVIALANFKGGAGKTTSAVNLAANLAQLGYQVLLIDLDAQANASHCLFKPAQLRGCPTVGEWLLAGAGTLRVAPVPDEPGEGSLGGNLALLPASVHLADQEEELAARPVAHQLLATGLQAVRPAYDFIVLDCPPSLGLMTRMALCAADYYLVPLMAEKFYFDGLKRLTQLADGIRAQHNPGLRLAGLFFCRYNPSLRRRLNHDIVHAAGHVYGEEAVLPAIRQDVALAEAQATATLLHRLAPASNGAADYRALTLAVLAVL